MRMAAHSSWEDSVLWVAMATSGIPHATTSHASVSHCEHDRDHRVGRPILHCWWPDHEGRRHECLDCQQACDDGSGRWHPPASTIVVGEVLGRGVGISMLARHVRLHAWRFEHCTDEDVVLLAKRLRENERPTSSRSGGSPSTSRRPTTRQIRLVGIVALSN